MRLLALLVLTLLVGCTPAHAPQTPHTGAALDLERKTVALVMPGNDGLRAYCSGVWVADDKIVTANHCVDDEDIGARVAYVVRGDVSAQDSDEVETMRLARLESRDEAHDLALLVAKLPPEHGIAAVASEVYAGEPAQTMGHPRGLWWSFSAGNVAAVRTHDDMTETSAMWWVQSTAPISPGNSGGGLFNEAHELLGIAHSYIPVHAENVNMYVHACYVRALLAPKS